ncbi:hypothetical protein [Pseudodesulfovibrio piezophilus]|uniref:Uncharacterized protein n=1 Tax=Pseudodesulfovibrio piezophilus (strain DSM 21447 / JCM 15486 / C1TLV30) TaxID=1322246 RepID=M1WSA1_PSEP2|nr:hypothetical protein [Pseudodesulfovibrio piezophilus]CCH48787.1 conserved protein of unknown function [Pseudodesulfovibrio piezophilus C1TLV30]
MSEEGQRIEFGDKGPYLFQVLAEPPQAMLLEDHDVCLLEFGQLYLPVSLDVCTSMAEGLANMSQAAMGPEKEGMIPVEFDLNETTELPLITWAAAESYQHEETIYMDVRFGETDARLCFSILAAATVGQILSQVPAE